MALPLLQPGDPAPDFALPAVNREGQVSLGDYRGRSPVLVGLFRGLHCPFCRRQIVQLNSTQDKLKALGVETMAVVNTPLERARLYFKYRPARVLLTADPEAATHRAFRVPHVTVLADGSATSWPETFTMEQILAARMNPTGELPEPQHPFAALETLNKKDGFEATEIDQQIMAAHASQMAGHFLIDPDGIIRWRHIEAIARPDDIGKLPGEQEIVAAARAL
jgi:peroxiredoxin